MGCKSRMNLLNLYEIQKEIKESFSILFLKINDHRLFFFSYNTKFLQNLIFILTMKFKNYRFSLLIVLR